MKESITPRENSRPLRLRPHMRLEPVAQDLSIKVGVLALVLLMGVVPLLALTGGRLGVQTWMVDCLALLGLILSIIAMLVYWMASRSLTK